MSDRLREHIRRESESKRSSVHAPVAMLHARLKKAITGLSMLVLEHGGCVSTGRSSAPTPSWACASDREAQPHRLAPERADALPEREYRRDADRPTSCPSSAASCAEHAESSRARLYDI